ncbi:hypothetical protein EPR50_G00181420 [Perca flavescens]|uniref:Uncharacterized protein n=1 Tax=Perca flavescens TaxID=8167 RepID=A0A484CKA8_PERFV|nr:hypothetical protein EPR50_G00181420 [Perca flavescens]
MSSIGCTELINTNHSIFAIDGRILGVHGISYLQSCMWLLFKFCIFMRNELRCFFYCLLNILLILLWTQIEVRRPVQIA